MISSLIRVNVFQTALCELHQTPNERNVIKTEEPTGYQPSLFDLASAFTTVLEDRLPLEPCDAVFIHSSPFLDFEIDTLLLDKIYHTVFRRGAVSQVVLNGITQADCAGLDHEHSGFEPVRNYLGSLGVPHQHQVVIPAAKNTAEEALGFLKLARERGWKRLIISSQPHHQVRCFLQAITIMKSMDYWPRVYNLTHSHIPWDRPIQKQILGGKPFKDYYWMHIANEIKRIYEYALEPPPPGEQGSFVQHATLKEMWVYLHRRMGVPVERTSGGIYGG